MTIASLGAIVAIPDSDNAIGGSGTTFTYDASTDLLAVIFQIPATGTISNVHYRVAATTSPVMTHRIELRTVDNTTGKPNAAGTLYGSSTSITKDASTYTSNTNMTAAVNATGATAGDICALVFDISAFTSGSFTQVQRFGGAIIGGLSNYPYQMTNTAASDVLAVLACNAIGIEYGTDTYYPLGFDAVVSSVSTAPTVTNSGTTRRGNRYRPAVPQRAIGIKIFGDLDGDCFLRLRLQSDDSILATATVDSSNRGTANINFQQYKFDSGSTVTLAAGTDYYILLEGNSATTDSIALISNIPENAQLGQMPGGATCYGTVYAGSYSDANTTRYGIGLLVDGFDNASGASGMLYVGEP